MDYLHKTNHINKKKLYNMQNEMMTKEGFSNYAFYPTGVVVNIKTSKPLSITGIGDNQKVTLTNDGGTRVPLLVKDIKAMFTEKTAPAAQEEQVVTKDAALIEASDDELELPTKPSNVYEAPEEEEEMFEHDSDKKKTGRQQRAEQRQEQREQMEAEKGNLETKRGNQKMDMDKAMALRRRLAAGITTIRQEAYINNLTEAAVKMIKAEVRFEPKQGYEPVKTYQEIYDAAAKINELQTSGQEIPEGLTLPRIEENYDGWEDIYAKHYNKAPKAPKAAPAAPEKTPEEIEAERIEAERLEKEKQEQIQAAQTKVDEAKIVLNQAKEAFDAAMLVLNGLTKTKGKGSGSAGGTIIRTDESVVSQIKQHLLDTGRKTDIKYYKEIAEKFGVRPLTVERINEWNSYSKVLPILADLGLHTKVTAAPAVAAPAGEAAQTAE